MEELKEIGARALLGGAIMADNSLRSDFEYIHWNPEAQFTHITLDGEFTAAQLEAMAWWMRNKAGKVDSSA